MASLNSNGARDISEKNNNKKTRFSFYEPLQTKDEEDLGSRSNGTNAADWQREWEGAVLVSQNRCVTASVGMHCAQKDVIFPLTENAGC